MVSEKKKKSSYSLLVILVFLLIIVFLGITNWRIAKKRSELASVIKKIERKIVKLEGEKVELEKEISCGNLGVCIA